MQYNAGPFGLCTTAVREEKEDDDTADSETQEMSRSFSAGLHTFTWNLEVRLALRSVQPTLPHGYVMPNLDTPPPPPK